MAPQDRVFTTCTRTGLNTVLHCPQDRGVHNVHKAKHRPTVCVGLNTVVCVHVYVYVCGCVVSSAALPPRSVSCVVCLSLRCRSLAFRALAQSRDLLGVLGTII